MNGSHWREPILERIYKCESFKMAYLARMSELNKSILAPERIHRRVDELAAILRTPIQEESPERFAELEKAAAGTKVTWSRGGTTSASLPQHEPGGDRWDRDSRRAETRRLKALTPVKSLLKYLCAPRCC